MSDCKGLNESKPDIYTDRLKTCPMYQVKWHEMSCASKKAYSHNKSDELGIDLFSELLPNSNSQKPPDLFPQLQAST